MNAVSKLFVAAALLFTANFAAAQTCPSFTKPSSTSLTAEQCTKLRSDLDKYIAYVNAWLAAQPLSKQRLLKPYVDAAIAEAKKYVNKVCPLPPGNGYSPNSPYACKVVDAAQLAVLNLGLNSSGTPVNDGSATKTICMSSAACQTIVSQKFIVFAQEQISACADPNDLSVQHLTDAELQSKINAIP